MSAAAVRWWTVVTRPRASTQQQSEVDRRRAGSSSSSNSTSSISRAVALWLTHHSHRSGFGNNNNNRKLGPHGHWQDEEGEEALGLLGLLLVQSGCVLQQHQRVRRHHHIEKLCAEGPLADAVDALDALSASYSSSGRDHGHGHGHQAAAAGAGSGRHSASNHLFYLVLKRCTITSRSSSRGSFPEEDRDRDRDDEHDEEELLRQGRRVHAAATRTGLAGDPFLATHLIGLYASHGHLPDAVRAFSAVAHPDVHNWAAIILAHAGSKAAAPTGVRLFRAMVSTAGSTPGSHAAPDNRVWVAALKACAGAGDLAAGRDVHARILESPARSSPLEDRFVAAALVSMYAKCGAVDAAVAVWEGLPAPECRPVEACNAIVAGYAKQGRGLDGLRFYWDSCAGGRGVRPTPVTYACLLQACAAAGPAGLRDGRRLHAELLRSGGAGVRRVAGALVSMYAKCGDLAAARAAWEAVPRGQRDVVAWTAVIVACVRCGEAKEAVRMYWAMEAEVDGGGVRPNGVTWVCALQACAEVGPEALPDGRRLHTRIRARARRRNEEEEKEEVGASLVNMYANCGGVAEARAVLDELGSRSVVAWNAMVAGYLRHGMADEAWALFDQMVVVSEQGQEEDRHGTRAPPAPDGVTYACLAGACARDGGAAALARGRSLHARVAQAGLLPAVAGALVNMYAKCGDVGSAREVLDAVPARSRDAAAWTAMMAAYAQRGRLRDGLHLYADMCAAGAADPTGVTFVCLLHACAGVGPAALPDGRRLHADMLRRGLVPEDAGGDGVVLGGSLVNMYAKCGDLGAARAVLDGLPAQGKDVVAWTALMAGYAAHGCGREALRLYADMRRLHSGDGVEPNAVTYVCLVQACAGMADAVQEGKDLHAEIVERGLLLTATTTTAEEKDEQTEETTARLGACLVDMYAKHSDVAAARAVFDGLSHKDVVAWNAMVGGYARNGLGWAALQLVRDMGVAPDAVTFVCALQACACVGPAAWEDGVRLHSRMIHLVLLLPRPPEEEHDARQEQEEEEQRQEHVPAATLAALGSALVHMYASCSSNGGAARAALLALPPRLRTVDAWNAALAGYARAGDARAAVELYAHGLAHHRLEPDAVTFVCLLRACATAGSLALGQHVHAHVMSSSLPDTSAVAVSSALVHMYAKCGAMPLAEAALDTFVTSSAAGGLTSALDAAPAWGALVGGNARHGDAESALAALDRMQQSTGVAAGTAPPDAITLLHVLTACSHAGEGFLDRGRALFRQAVVSTEGAVREQMVVCMVDMLARAGRLDEAVQLAKSSGGPAAAWRAVLAACVKWRDVEIGRVAFEAAVEASGDAVDRAAPYVLMGNVYAGAGMWREAREVRRLGFRVEAGRKKRRKGAASWWVDGDGVAHPFGVGAVGVGDDEGDWEDEEEEVEAEEEEEAVGLVPVH